MRQKPVYSEMDISQAVMTKELVIPKGMHPTGKDTKIYISIFIREDGGMLIYGSTNRVVVKRPTMVSDNSRLFKFKSKTIRLDRKYNLVKKGKDTDVRLSILPRNSPYGLILNEDQEPFEVLNPFEIALIKNGRKLFLEEKGNSKLL